MFSEYIVKTLRSKMVKNIMYLYYFNFYIVYYSHFIGHLLSRYRRISDCLYSIVYGHAGRYALCGPLCTLTARIARYNVAYLPLEPSGYAT